MKRFFTFAILITGIWIFAACGRDPAQSELAIGGGVPLTSQATSLVRIALRNQSICTGVLVASDLVLTAAHCLRSDDSSLYTVIFPMNPSDKIRPVDEFQKVREDSLVFFPNFDLAWIRLKANAPSPYVPATLLGNTNQIKAEAGLTLVGTANETPCNPSDINCQLVKLSVRLVSSWSSPHLINLAVVDSIAGVSNSGTCPGDSGGPAFISHLGQDLLFGLVAGKDPIFTGGVSTSCGSPRSVLTRIGEYQDWIESTSGRRLKVIDPSPSMLDLEFLNGSNDQNYQTWQDWFQKPLAGDSAWTTVHKILEQAVLEFQGRISAEQIPQLFQRGGQDWIDQLTTLRSLTLGFPEQSVALVDLRPLVGLTNLTDLTFLSRSYKGLDVLGRMPKLKSLSIVGRVVPQNEQGQFTWAQLSSPSLTTLRLSQITSSHVGNINWQNLPNLNSLIVASPLGKILSSFIHEDKLTRLTVMQIQEFSCDVSAWPRVPMPNMKSLIFRTTGSLTQTDLSCVKWELLPNLSELSIQGYKIDVPSFTQGMPEILAAQIRRQSP